MSKAKYQLPSRFEKELNEVLSNTIIYSVNNKRAVLRIVRKYWQMREMELKVVQPRKRSLLPWK